MHAEPAEDMAYYKSPEAKPPKKEPLNLRVSDSLRAMLNDTVTLWRMLAKANGEDFEQIDLTYVCARLLEVGADGAFGEVDVQLTEKDDEDRVKLRPALSGPADEDGKPKTYVVTPAEWKKVAKVIEQQFADKTKK